MENNLPYPANLFSLADRSINYLSHLPSGVHYIRPNFILLPVTILKDFIVDNGSIDPFPMKCRLNSFIYGVVQFHIFLPEPLHKENREFIHILFSNKGIDVINISTILHHKEVVSKFPLYFKIQSLSILSYSYTKTISSIIFNHKKTLQTLWHYTLKS